MIRDSIGTEYAINPHIAAKVGGVGWSGVVFVAGILLALPLSVKGQGSADWDSRFGPPGTNGGVTDIAQKGDSLVVVGSFSAVGNTKVRKIALFDLRSKTWSALGSGITGEANAVTIGESGEIYVGGLFSAAGNVDANNIAVWDGSNWHALGSGVNERVWDLGFSDGLLYAVGHFTLAGGEPANKVAVWDGSAWRALGEGSSNGIASGAVYALAVDDLGHLFVGGRFQEAGGVPATSLASWDGVRWTPFEPELRTTETTGVVVFGLEWREGQLTVGGRFTHAGNIEVNHIASFYDGHWHSFGPGVQGEVVTVSTAPAGEVFATGFFAGPEGISSLAFFTAGTWNLVPEIYRRPANVVRAIDSTRVAVGHYAFLIEEGNPAQFLFEWDRSTGAWGVLDHEAKGLDGPVYALISDGDGGFYAGGLFTFAGQTPAASIAHWDGGDWAALGEGLSGRVYTLAISANGDVYAGGYFTGSGSKSIANVGRWDGAEWHPLGTGISFPEQPGLDEVHALLALGDTLYVGGLFTQAGGNPSPFLALWDLETEEWLLPSFGSPDGPIHSIVSTSDGLVYFGGAFDGIGPETGFRNLAVWDGQSWNRVGEGSAIPLWALAPDGDEVLGAGSFNGVYAVSRWDGSAWHTLGEFPFFNTVHALSVAEGVVFAAGRFEAVDNPDGQILPTNRIAALTESGWVRLSGGGLGGGAVHALLIVDNDLFAGGEIYFAGQEVDDTVLEPGTGIPSVGLAAYLNAITLAKEADLPIPLQPTFSTYPNPVSAGRPLDIVFEQRVGGPVKLVVWDMLGRLVRKDELGWYDIGRHRVTIDRVPTAAGSYLFQLSIPGSPHNHLVTITK